MNVLQLLEMRRSYRIFQEDKTIPMDVWQDIMNSARLSASGMNRQVLRYIIVKDQDLVHQIFPHTLWAAALPKGLGQPKEGERPTGFIIVLAPQNATPLVHVDAGIAMSNMTLMAWEHQVGSCILQNIKRDEISRIVSIPTDYQIHSVIGLGYVNHHSTVVKVPASGRVAYTIDDNRNYFVPKRSTDELFTIL